MAIVAAIDCGATSVRVCRVDLEAPSLVPEVVHRVAHTPRRDAAGHLRWDWTAITSAVELGLERCLELGPIDSIGVDTWAVDYGLLDGDGHLIADPFSYRDERTSDYRALVDEFGATRMYESNGLQLQPFNTIFQLAVHDRSELERAERLLWLPELLVHHLCGATVTERTSAGCSGLVDVSTGAWSRELCDLARIDSRMLGEIVSAGRVVGEWRGVPVSLVAGHDTASAVAGMGTSSSGGSAFVATGTWMLAGIERDAADTSTWARRRNFTNEAAALAGFRFLRNVTGFWLLEQCRPEWRLDVGELVDRAAAVEAKVPIVDVDDESLRSPDDMLTAYTALAGLRRDADPALVTRSIVESVAVRTADVLAEVEVAQPFDDVVLFGGAARIELLVARLRDFTRRAIRVGPAEAAALGNALVQGVAIGALSTLDAGRERITGSVYPKNDRRTAP